MGLSLDQQDGAVVGGAGELGPGVADLLLVVVEVDRVGGAAAAGEPMVAGSQRVVRSLSGKGEAPDQTGPHDARAGLQAHRDRAMRRPLSRMRRCARSGAWRTVPSTSWPKATR